MPLDVARNIADRHAATYVATRQLPFFADGEGHDLERKSGAWSRKAGGDITSAPSGHANRCIKSVPTESRPSEPLRGDPSLIGFGTRKIMDVCIMSPGRLHVTDQVGLVFRQVSPLCGIGKRIK